MNLNPLPCWKTGAQHVALNMCNPAPDVPAQLHFALFEGTGGYVRKPREMTNDGCAVAGWPPPRENLKRVTIELLSLHGLPQGREARPRTYGFHGESHRYLPQLTGHWVAPTAHSASSPLIKVSLYSIGGFCAVSETLPPASIKTEHVTMRVRSNGLNPHFGETVCAPLPSAC